MSELLTEEQQIEAFKRWWKQYGNLAIGVCLVCIFVYLGIGYWKSSQEKAAQATSVIYDQFIETLDKGEAKSVSADKLAAAQKLAADVVTQNASGLYADLVSFVLAKEAVDQEQLDDAAKRLQRIIDQSASAESVQLAQLRLAKVRAAQADMGGALALLGKKRSKSYEASYAEARGDILLSQNKLDEARSAYQAALTALQSEEGGQSQRSSLVKFKMDSARVATVDPLAIPSNAAAPVGSNPHANLPVKTTGDPQGAVADSSENAQ